MKYLQYAKGKLLYRKEEMMGAKEETELTSGHEDLGFIFE